MADYNFTRTGAAIQLLHDRIDFGSLTANTTVNFNSTMTAAQIQALIDAQPRNLNGFILTFQFADGTYTLNASLVFPDFIGGILSVLGNIANNTLSITKAVILNFSAGADGILVYRNQGLANVNYLKVNMATASNFVGINLQHCSSVSASYNYILSASAAGVECIRTNQSFGNTIGNMFGLSLRGLSTFRGYVASTGNDDNGGGDQPVTGLFALGGTITKSGTQPTGSSANEGLLNGGVIR